MRESWSTEHRVFSSSSGQFAQKLASVMSGQAGTGQGGPPVTLQGDSKRKMSQEKISSLVTLTSLECFNGKLTDIECYLVLRFYFPSFPERLWSVMTGSEVSHDVMTQTDPDPGDRRHCVSGTSPASLRRAKVQWLQHWAPLLWSASGILLGYPGLGEHVKDEGSGGDHRGRDQGEHGHGGDNNSGHICRLQCCRVSELQRSDVRLHHTRNSLPRTSILKLM